MNKELQILILEDRTVDAELMMFELRHNGIQFQAKRVWTAADFVAELRNPALDLILADYSLPSFDGLSALKLAREARPELPFLLVSGSLGEELAVEALRNGATDYLLKQRPARLGPAVRRALREVAERNRRQRAEEEARRNEQNYREIFNATHEAIFVHDAATGEILDVNQTMLDMFGYPREDLSTLTGEAFRSTEPYTHQEARRRMRLAVTEGPQVFEWLSRKKSGETFWTEVALRATSVGGEGRVLAVVRDISERKRSEEALRKREADLRLAQQIGHIGSWEVDLDSNTLQWSEETYRIFGCDPGTFVPTREAFAGLIHPDDRGRVQRAAAEAFRTATAYQVEHRILRPDGTERIVAEHALIQRDAQGQAARLVGTVQDITERQRAEEAARESEARIRQVIEASPVPLAVDDALGNIEYLNRKFITTFGYEREDIPTAAEWFVRAYPNPEYRRSVQERWGEAVQRAQGGNQEISPVEADVTCKDGSMRTVEFRGCFVGGRALIAGNDITERKRAEAQIREQASLLDLTQDGIAVRDLAGRVQYWNKGSERITGWTAEEIMGQSVDEFLELDGAFVDATLQTLLQRGEWSGEIKMTAKDGRLVTLLSRCSLVRDPEGQPKSVLVISTDITERKELEAQFLRAQRLESIGQLAGGIAHDLNNILSPIMMIVPLLREELKNPGMHGMLDMVAQSTQRGADIIKQILTFSRGLTGEKAPVQTRHLLKEVGKIAHETFPRSIEIKTRVPNDLWLVEGDATQLHQVLMNLAVNARDAMPNGGVLTLSAQNIVVDEALARRSPDARTGPHVVWLVADTGTGMTAEVLDRMFDPFFSTKPQGQGTGLGLSTTLGIVQGHGGFLQVESRLGEGTNFRVYLPAQQELEVLAHQPTTELPDGKGDLVLVVDDEEGIRSVLQRTLEICGFKVVTAGDGMEAIAILQSRHREIELVLVDLMMPRLGGLAVIREAKALDPSMRILVASGMCDDAQSMELQRLGVTHFLPKPFTTSSLATTLRECLASDANIEDGR